MSKYPRTHHLPSSLGKSDDDEVLVDDMCFWDKEVVYTEKLDGECTSMTRPDIHARSEDSNHHLSQSWVKNLHATIAYMIPEDIQIVGENMYAKHSIFYNRLSTFFYVFAAIDLYKQIFLSYYDTRKLCKELNLEMVPQLHLGPYVKDFKLRTTSYFGDTIEGYVVRNVDSFAVSDMSKNLAKWVRKDHVRTDQNWRQTWTPNKLMPELRC